MKKEQTLSMIFIKCGAIFLMLWGILISFDANAGTNLNSKQPQSDNAVFDIHLKQAPLVETLQQLALEHHVNLIINDELEGTLSLQLNNTDLDQLFRAAAKIKQLDLWQENGIYYLNKLSDNQKFASAMNVMNANSASNEPAESATNLAETTMTTSIKLHYAKASEVMKSLTGGSGSLLSPEGSLTFDERSNLLLIQDYPDSVRKIKKLIAEMDKPIEQIAIEARIVTINDEDLKELGVRWGIFTPTDAAHKVSGSLSANGFNNIADNLNVNFATNTTPAASIALQVAKINGRLLDLELTALERENNVKIIASPKLLTTNKKSASIKQGTEIPYVIASKKDDDQSIEFREAVLGLEVTPHISRDNSILLDLVVSQNSPGNRIAYGVGELVSIDKQEINTQVFAKDGETIVLGGIFQDTITQGTDKVPILGDIPVVKTLFSKNSERHQKRELVIFVTPHILKPGQNLEELKKHKAKLAMK